MDINAAFPSSYLKAADLQGKDVKLTIDAVAWESINDEQKPVLYFMGKKLGLVLNKTNASAISDQLGFETDNWHNKIITIFPTQTDFQGKTVACIRVRLADAIQHKPQPQAQPAETQQPGDDIPF